MAICRFSDYQCDLYIYESALGIECHVARSRYENEPEPPLFPVGEDAAEWAQYWRDYEAYRAQIDAARMRSIGLPYAGEFRTFGAWGELLEYVTELKALGHRVPDWVIEHINEEAT